MGKVTKKRISRPRVAPAGIISVAEVQDQGSAQAQGSNSHSTLASDAPVALKKLTVGDTGDRIWAAASIGHLLLQPDPDSDAKDGQSTRKLLLSNNAIGHLVHAMNDMSMEVVLQATGTLCNLAASDLDYSQEMTVNADIFEKGIRPLLPKLSNSLECLVINNEQGQKMDIDERNTLYGITSNVVSIIWNLCENSDRALKAANKLGFVPFLMAFFDPSAHGKIPKALVETAAQCLFTLSDNNREAQLIFIHHPTHLKTLLNVVSSGGDAATAFTRILAGGVLNNIKELVVSSQSTAHDIEETLSEVNKLLLPLLNEYIHYDVQGEAQVAIQCLEAMKASCGGHADAAALEQNKLDGIIGRAVNVQLALEMIANIFSEEGVDSDEDRNPTRTGKLESSGRNESMDIDGHDKSEEDSDSGMDQGDDVEKTDDKEEDEEGEGLEGEGKGDEDDEFDADDMDNILAEEGTASRATTTLMSGGGSIISYFVDNIVPSLFNLMQPTHVSFANTEALNPVSNPLSVVSETFSALHQRAFGCFNNFLLIVEEVQKTWFKVNLQATVDWWSNLARLVEQISQSRSVNIDANASAKESQQQQQQQQHEEVLEGAIGCLWACARGLKAAGYMASAPAPSALVEGLVGICQTSRSPSLHVKCIGALGLLACREPGFVEDNRKIGTFLIQGIQATLASADGARISHEHLEPVIEALDSIYDIYSDKAFDYDQPVFVRGEFLKALKQALPEYRKVVRVSIDRRKHRELRERADLALANLRAFVDFKAQEAS